MTEEFVGVFDKFFDNIREENMSSSLLSEDIKHFENFQEETSETTPLQVEIKKRKE
jgi:hypothetical protein